METIQQSRTAFHNRGLHAAWNRVNAVVVQPWCGIWDASIHEYDRAATADLVDFFENQPFIYEAHSTDYQTESSLRQLVEDHFAILKVGPVLTFAYREAIFSLAMIENEAIGERQRSNLISVIDQVMVDNPVHWCGYYHGTDEAIRLARKYSLAIEFVGANRRVQTAIKEWFDNLIK